MFFLKHGVELFRGVARAQGGRSVVLYGPQISEIYGPRCWGSSSFEGDVKKGQLFFRNKCTLAASVPSPAPSVKSWLGAWNCWFVHEVVYVDVTSSSSQVTELAV